MSRKWHVEHADGREWTREELKSAFPSLFALFVLDEEGNLGVLYRTVECQKSWEQIMAYDWDDPAVNECDMVVVWDE